MPRPLLGLLLFGLFVSVLVATMPARLLGYVLPADQVMMNGYSGTLWRGRAAQSALAAGEGYFNLGSVEWSLEPLSLLFFSPTLAIQSNWGRQKVSGRIEVRGRRSFVLQDLEASVSARVAQQFLPLAVDGEFGASIGYLEIEQGLPIEGEGRILWRGAGWLTSQGVMPLGSYALDFRQVPDSALQGTVITITGPVNASGDVSLTEQQYDLDVLLSSDGGLNSQLKQALSLIAQPVTNGYRVLLNGQLTDLENK